MGYQLHNLYGAFEQLFKETARFFENRVDAGSCRADLLRRMQLEIQGIRPALLSAETASGLDELRRFRHFFRHAYTAATWTPGGWRTWLPGRRESGADSTGTSSGSWLACSRSSPPSGAGDPQCM